MKSEQVTLVYQKLGRVTSKKIHLRFLLLFFFFYILDMVVFLTIKNVLAIHFPVATDVTVNEP